MPDTVAQPSPILTAFLHFQRCFGIERFPLEEMPVKELGCKALQAPAQIKFQTMRLEEICPYRWKNPDREAPSTVVLVL